MPLSSKRGFCGDTDDFGMTQALKLEHKHASWQLMYKKNRAILLSKRLHAGTGPPFISANEQAFEKFNKSLKRFKARWGKGKKE